MDVDIVFSQWDNPVVSRHRAGSAGGKKNDSFWKSGDDKWMDLGRGCVHSPPRISLLTSSLSSRLSAHVVFWFLMGGEMSKRTKLRLTCGGVTRATQRIVPSLRLGPPPVFSPSTGRDWLDVPFPDYTFRYPRASRYKTDDWDTAAGRDGEYKSQHVIRLL